MAGWCSEIGIGRAVRGKECFSRRQRVEHGMFALCSFNSGAAAGALACLCKPPSHLYDGDLPLYCQHLDRDSRLIANPNSKKNADGMLFFHVSETKAFDLSPLLSCLYSRCGISFRKERSSYAFVPQIGRPYELSRYNNCFKKGDRQ